MGWLSPSWLTDRARFMVRRLEVHQLHNEVAGAVHHFARHATLAAACIVGESSAEVALQIDSS